MKCNNYSSVLSANLIGEKIIIAGCNGYIGTELTNQLELNNIAYIGIDKTPTNNNNCLNFNLSNKKQVIDVISAENPDYFFHMATHSALAYKNDFLDVFCHQIPSRCFTVFNHHLGICSRCLGIYFGCLFFSEVFWIISSHNLYKVFSRS